VAGADVNGQYWDIYSVDLPAVRHTESVSGCRVGRANSVEHGTERE
jgi:hypothetical protein